MSNDTIVMTGAEAAKWLRSAADKAESCLSVEGTFSVEIARQPVRRMTHTAPVAHTSQVKIRVSLDGELPLVPVR